MRKANLNALAVMGLMVSAGIRLETAQDRVAVVKPDPVPNAPRPLGREEARRRRQAEKIAAKKDPRP